MWRSKHLVAHERLKTDEALVEKEEKAASYAVPPWKRIAPGGQEDSAAKVMGSPNRGAAG